MNESISHRIEAIYHQESRRIFATLVRLLGDMDLAEEALQEAFKAAVAQWPNQGVPANPRAWLVSAGRFKMIDFIRRQTRLDTARQALLDEVEDDTALDDDAIGDDRLRLIFTCCHPAIGFPVQVALTLREVCGMSTEAIASAFLVPPATLAQRLVRGKAKIRTAGIPYQVPELSELPERLDSVLAVIYLVFNEGYRASSGHALTRPDLSQEAIRLARLLQTLLPDAEVNGLLALMLLHESRRATRLSASGELVLLEQQDRRRWDQAMITEAKQWLVQALAPPAVGRYALEAAIAAVHADAADFNATDWAQIVALYDLLLRATPSPVVELNRAVAVAMRDGPAAGLALVDGLRARGELADYQLFHAAKADLHRRLDQHAAARSAYERALQLATQGPEQRFLRARLAQLDQTEK